MTYHTNSTRLTREIVLDDLFHAFVSHIENKYIHKGIGWVPENLSSISEQDLDGVLWQVEEESGVKPVQDEINQSFREASQYAKKILKRRGEHSIYKAI